jgi:hypothetical protein
MGAFMSKRKKTGRKKPKYPSDDEISSYFSEFRSNYDPLVDYRIETVEVPDDGTLQIYDKEEITTNKFPKLQK